MDFAAARRNMVESQIRPNRVTDERLIAALAMVPREEFVPKALRGIAYIDEDLPIGDGRYLMEPMVLARLIQTAEPAPTDLALIIGVGTGYAAAVLSHLVGGVVAVESDPALAQRAIKTLTGMGNDTVAVIEGPLANGCPVQAPFDVIFFNGAVAEIPGNISAQLAEGGRLVAVVAGNAVGKAVLVAHRRGVLTSREVFDAAIPLLPGFERKSAFVF